MSDYLNFLDVNGISFDDIVVIAGGSSLPNTGGGQNGPIGSLYFTTSNQLFRKTGSGDTDWTEVKDVEGFIIDGNVIPSAGAGIDAPLGTLYIDRVNGTLYQKTGVPDTSWTRLAQHAQHALTDHTDVDTAGAIVGDSLKWDGTIWKPSSSLPSTSATNNYLYIIDKTTQVFQAANTFQPLNFSQNVFLNGWTHPVNTPNITCAIHGQYAATVEINVQKNGGGQVTATAYAEVSTNGGISFDVYLEGSTQGMNITSNNTSFSISRTFLFQVNAGDILRIQIGGQSTQAKVTPAPFFGPATGNEVSASLLIRRLT